MERSQQIIGAVEGILRGQGFDVQPDNRLPAHPGVNMLIPLQEDGTELVFTELHFIEGPEGIDQRGADLHHADRCGQRSCLH